MYNSKTVEASIYDLIPSPNQPRIDEKEGIDELKESIQNIGLINKPKVILHPELAGKYIIQTGHRRLRALKELGLQTVLVEVLEKEDPRIPLVDNMLRVDLHVVELANAIKEGISEELFFDEEDVVNSTGLSLKDVETMLLFGGKLNDYIVLFLLQNKKQVFSSSYDVLIKLAELAELKPGKKIVMSVLNEIKKREIEDGANIKAFKELIDIEIKDYKEKLKEKEREEEREREEEKEELEKTEIEEEKKEVKNIYDLIDEDSELEESKIVYETESGEEELLEYENTLKDLGLTIMYDDDWRNIRMEISVDDLSKISATKLLSVFEKIEKKIK